MLPEGGRGAGLSGHRRVVIAETVGEAQEAPRGTCDRSTKITHKQLPFSTAPAQAAARGIPREPERCGALFGIVHVPQGRVTRPRLKMNIFLCSAAPDGAVLPTAYDDSFFTWGRGGYRRCALPGVCYGTVLVGRPLGVTPTAGDGFPTTELDAIDDGCPAARWALEESCAACSAATRLWLH